MSLDTVKPKGIPIESYDRLSQILIDSMEFESDPVRTRFDPCNLVTIVGRHALRALPARNLLPLRPADIVIVLDIMGQFMDLHGAEPCLPEILDRHLLALHGAEAIATLRQ